MASVTGVDSWWEPDSTQIAQAKAAGYGAWLGYISNGSYAHPDGIYNGWADATFAAIQAAGLLTAAYCSSRDDPNWVKAKAASLGIRAILDCEPSVMSNWADAAAQDAWLAVSGAALYGSGPRYGSINVMSQHLNHGHPGLVLADYSLGDEGTTWPARDPRPTAPTITSWQYAGGVDFVGRQVDIGHYDVALLQSAPTPIEESDDMSGYNAAWDTPERNQQDHMQITGDGKLWHRWYSSTAGQQGPEEMTSKYGDSIALVPGTLEVKVSAYSSQYHLYATGVDGAQKHYFLGFSTTDTWHFESYAMGPPLTQPSAGSSGLTAAQAAQLADIQAKLATIEAALKGA